MLKLLMSAFRRIVTAVTNPFRMLIVRIQRMFNINVITAKLVRPLTKKVKSLITLRPQSREDYYVIGRWWVYKKLFLTLLMAACAGVFIYFTMFAPKLPAAAVTAASVETNVYFNYDDMDLRNFSGVANIRAADGQVVYTGDVDKGVCTGNGTLWDRKGRLEYRGGFEQNQFSGKGVYYYPDGKKKYEGGWAANLYQGEGILYAEDGATPLYSGGFQNGLYEGDGKAWSTDGTLLYEGQFSGGLYHGEGVSYYPDGTARYRGEFHSGLPQGRGELYSEAGKLLYTGDVYAGQINYRALVNYNFAEVREAFTEAPRVFYTDTDSAFLFEQAGVVVMVDCRVRVDTWERPAKQEDNGAFYYLPGERGELPQTAEPTPEEPVSEGVNPAPLEPAPEGDAVPVGSGGRAPMAAQTLRAIRILPNLSSPSAPGAGGVYALPGAAGPAPEARQVDWYVAEDSTGSYEPPADASGSSSSDASSDLARSQPDSRFPEDPRIQSDADDSSSSVPEILVDPYPEFVEKDQKLYFEIDTDVWKTEKELKDDAEKIRVRKVAVYSGGFPEPPAGAVEYDDDAPSGLEDCVAIDMLRQGFPTAFPQIRFEADRQNRLFVRLWNIDFASKIDRRVYLSGDLTYRYAYQEDLSGSPLYFSVER